MRPRLKIHFPDSHPHSAGSYIELDGKPIAVRGVEFTARHDQRVTCLVDFHPDSLTVDVEGECLRLNGAQLPKTVAISLRDQLNKLFPAA